MLYFESLNFHAQALGSEVVEHEGVLGIMVRLTQKGHWHMKVGHRDAAERVRLQNHDRASTAAAAHRELASNVRPQRNIMSIDEIDARLAEDEEGADSEVEGSEAESKRSQDSEASESDVDEGWGFGRGKARGRGGRKGGGGRGRGAVGATPSPGKGKPGASSGPGGSGRNADQEKEKQEKQEKRRKEKDKDEDRDLPKNPLCAQAVTLVKKTEAEYSDQQLWESKPRSRQVQRAAEACSALSAKLAGIAVETPEAEPLSTKLFKLGSRIESLHELFLNLRQDPAITVDKMTSDAMQVLSSCPRAVLTNVFTTVLSDFTRDFTHQDVQRFYRVACLVRSKHFCLSCLLDSTDSNSAQCAGLQQQMVAMWYEKLLKSK